MAVRKSAWQKKKKTSARSPALASAWIAPKICQGQLQTIHSEFPKFHPNPFTSGGVIAERVNIVETRHKVFPILGEASSPSNEPSCPYSPQPQSTTALWPVLISRPDEGRRLSWPRWIGEINLLMWFAPFPPTPKTVTHPSISRGRGRPELNSRSSAESNAITSETTKPPRYDRPLHTNVVGGHTINEEYTSTDCNSISAQKNNYITIVGRGGKDTATKTTGASSFVQPTR